jgi:hypothetical protein
MKTQIFKTLARINKVIMPSFKHRDLTQLKTWEKAMIGYRYWVTKNALGN